MNLKKYYRAAAVATLTTILSGCNESGSRPCDGFGLPLADVWSTGLSVGDTATFVNQLGDTKTLVLSSRVDSEPYEGSSRFGPEEVVCVMTSERRYISEEDNTALSFEFTQVQGFGDSEDEQGVGISVIPESPPEASLGYNFLFSVFDVANWYPAVFTNDNPGPSISRDTRHIVNYSNSINDYPLAVEQIYLYEDGISNQDSPAAISRVVFAENGGLVQFETLSGDIFSRTDTQQ